LSTTGSNVWDTGRWAHETEAHVDFMTEYCFRTLCRQVDIKGKSILELGAGTGRLSYLCLQNGAAGATLVDSSDRAINLMRGLFRDEARVSIVQDDILTYRSEKSHDIVLSSGVIEHFRMETRARLISQHVELARECAVILHPADSIYYRLFAALPLAKKWYGYQKSFSDEEMYACAKLAGARIAFNERFYMFMTIPLLHNTRLNAIPWIERVARRYGIFQITVLARR